MSKMPKKIIPTFAVFKNNEKVKTLEHCFIKESNMTKDDYLCLQCFQLKTKEGLRRYEIVWDDSIHLPIAELGKTEILPVVISFQKHSYGNFAVIKEARGV